MFTAEENALDVLLFESKGEELLDIKCFRGNRADTSAEEIKAAIHSGIMQYKLQPSIGSPRAPTLGVEPRDMAEFVKGLPTNS
jgi:hypothetical protein